MCCIFTEKHKISKIGFGKSEIKGNQKLSQPGKVKLNKKLKCLMRVTRLITSGSKQLYCIVLK